jgi:PII-like signaling protein
VVEVIDTPQNIERILPIIAPAVKNGLITTEKVQIVKYGVG